MNMIWWVAIGPGNGVMNPPNLDMCLPPQGFSAQPQNSLCSEMRLEQNENSHNQLHISALESTIHGAEGTLSEEVLVAQA